MKLVTGSEMKLIESAAMEKYKIPSIILMENAALGVVEECLEFKGASFLVVAGKGNNGGDGLAAARHLFIAGEKINIVFIGDREKATPDCKTNLIAAENLGIPIIYIDEELSENAASLISSADVVIDSMIGTGLTRSLSPIYTEIVDKINSADNYVISVDCPTGIDSDNGNIYSSAVKANLTVTFFRKKLGLALYPACSVSGKVKIKGISIPESSENFVSLSHNSLTLSQAREFLPKRDDFGHKGTFGKVYSFTGSSDMTGAAFLSSLSAYRMGCGLLHLCAPSAVTAVLRTLLPEAVTHTLPDINGKLCKESLESISISDADVIITGCGIGRGEKVTEFVFSLIESAQCPLVIDADALNAIAEEPSVLSKAKNTVIVTPHLGEMSRLTNTTISFISNNIVASALEFSRKYNVITVLKSSRTVIASPDGTVFINETGSSAMSKGGTGDCLSGITAALMAQGGDPYHSAVLACYINGFSAQLCTQAYTSYSTLARDLIDNLPGAVARILESC
ncbi:MAG: NAD(P)H-hydrate dehydratase [Firmicutes bacterium]|nr:NAD(P)H-hydrate dehydratase [Bacillota bacterium]